MLQTYLNIFIALFSFLYLISLVFSEEKLQVVTQTSKRGGRHHAWSKQAKWWNVLHSVNHKNEDNQVSKESDQVELKVLLLSHCTTSSPNSPAVNSMPESNGTLITKIPTVMVNFICLLG